MERAEHLKWAKERAREYIRLGDREQAVASMMSDLNKHEAWQSDMAVGMLGIAALHLGTMKAVRDFVEGFN